MKNKNHIALCLCLVATLSSGWAQSPLERHQAIVAYVFNFAKNITWKDEAQLTAFQFLIISNDDLFRPEFNKLAAQKTIKGKPIKVSFINKPDNLGGAQLIFADTDFEPSLIDITRKIEGKNILLVTDQYHDRRFVMINIIETETHKLHFEINKANILNQQLTIGPDMIFLGGSEIDVASIYKEAQKNLLTMQQQLDKLSALSNELQEKIRLNEIEVDKQNKLSAEQELLIRKQLQELSAQETRLKAMQSEVKTKSSILQDKTRELEDKKNWLKEQEMQVEKANQVLKSLNTSIDSLNHQVQEKEQELNLRGYTIASQNKILYGLVAVIALAAIAVFLLLKWYRQKNKLNLLLTANTKELETTNEELIQTQEEIAAQRDIVANQNKELEQSKIIIEKQNQEIKERNINLEVEVENRTKELVEYNQQLEQFAFVSAHNLRAPVARILGLGNLLALPEHENDPHVIGKLVHTTRELDRVVRDLNTILEVRKNSTNTISEIDLAEEIELVKISLATEIADTQTILVSELGEVKTIRAIRPYFDSILMNLVSNAIKYRHRDRKPRITIKTEVRNNFACVIVKDNGLGIDLNLHGDKLFKLYSRFHDHVEGKGLGLYLTKTQVIAMGGKLEVESTVNEGTTFFVYLKIQ